MIPSTLPPAPDNPSPSQRRRDCRRPCRRRRWVSAALALLTAAAALFGVAQPASAWVGTPDEGLGKYWLPPNHSAHGDDIDMLFIWIFWITMIIFVVVEVVLVVFLVKYRSRPGRRGVFTHGNTKLEMTWTLAPALILIALALYTKRVWDVYRYGEAAQASDKAKLLVIGQQFKWSVVYPGPDGELGAYLRYPRTSDPQYAWMPYDQAKQAIEDHVRADNPLGRYVNPDNKADPGLDDDWTKYPGRPVIVPVNRPIEISLSSKDVLHDFFLPNFRVKLDAVPNLHGKIHFKALKQSTSTAPVALAEIPPDKKVWIDQNTPTARFSTSSKTWFIPDPADKRKRREWLSSLDRLDDGARARLLRKKVKIDQITPQMLADEVAAFRADLAKAGITQLTVVDTPFEIVCEELCGLGHATMNGEFLVVSQQEYADFVNREALGKNPGTKPPAAATQPVAAAP